MRDFVFVELDNCFGKLDFVWLDKDVVDFNKRDFILWTGRMVLLKVKLCLANCV